MSDQSTAPSAKVEVAPDANAFTHFARLVRGKTYFLGNKQFTSEKGAKVTAAEKLHLETYAVDPVTIRDGTSAEAEYRQKFAFDKLADDGSVVASETKAPQERRRRPAA